MDPTDAPTQGTDPAEPGTGTEGSEGADPSKNGKAQDGVQKRIDELTARVYEKDRQLTEQQQLVQTLMLQQMAAQQQAQRAPEPSLPDVPEGVDPALFATFLKAAEVTAAKQMAALEARLAPALRQTHQTQAQMVIERESNGNAELSRRANALYADWQRRGFPGEPQDAVVFTQGQMVREGASAAARSRDELGRFNGGAATLRGGGPPPNLGAAPAEPAVPEFADQNSDAFDARKAAAYWKQRITPKK